MDTAVKKAGALKSVGACILAPFAWIVGAGLAGGIYSVVQTLFTVLRPGLIGFFAAIVGAAGGVMAARWVCDRWLTGYSSRAVFVVFACIVAAGLYFEFVVLPLAWSRVASYAQLIFTAVLSYVYFWQREPL